MAAGREEYTIVLKAKDDAARVLKALGKSGVRAARDTDKTFRRTSSTLRSVGNAGKTALTKIAAGARLAGRAVKTSLLGPLAPLLATLVAVGGAFSITRQAATFSEAMSEVSTIVDTSVVSMGRLRDGVLELAKAQGLNEAIVARGLYSAISSGIDAGADALKFLRESNALAIAGLADSEVTVKALASTLNSYRKGVEQTAAVSDAFFTAVKKGQTTISELAGSMSQATPFAAQLGVSLDELLSLVAAITLSGTPTAEAVTQVRAAMVGLLKKSKEVDAVLRSRLGKSFSLQRIQAEGLLPILQDLRAAYAGNEDGLSTLLGRVEATTAVLNVTGDATGRVVDILDAMESKTGATQEALQKRLADPAFRVAVAFNAIRQELVKVGGAQILAALDLAIDKVGGLEDLTNQATVAAKSLAGAVDILLGGLTSLVRAARDTIAELGGTDRVAEIIEAKFAVMATGTELAFERVRTAVEATISSIQRIPALLTAVTNKVNITLEETFAGTPLGPKKLGDRIREAAANLRGLGSSSSDIADRLRRNPNDPVAAAALAAQKETFGAQEEELKRLLREAQSRRDFILEDVVADIQTAAGEAAARGVERTKGLVQTLAEQRAELEKLLARSGGESGALGPALPLPPSATPPAGALGRSFPPGALPPGARPEGLPPEAVGIPSRPDLREYLDAFEDFNRVRGSLMGEITLSLEEQRSEIGKWADEERLRIALLAEENKITAEQEKTLRGLVDRLKEQKIRTAESSKETSKFGQVFPPGALPPGARPEGLPPEAVGIPSRPDLREYLDAFEDFNRVRGSLMGEITLSLEEQRSEIGKWADEERLRIALLAEENKITAEQEKTLRGLVDRLKEQKIRTAESSKETSKFGQVGKDVARTLERGLGDSLADIIRQSGRGSAAFKEFARSILADIAEIGLRAALSKILTSAAPSIFGAAKGAVFPGGLQFPSYAGGGVARSPQLAEIGEGRNHEAVIPMPDNRHVPVKMVGGGGGGGGGSSLVLNLSIDGRSAGSSGNDQDAEFVRRIMPMVERSMERALVFQRGLQLGIRQVARGR